jgi:sporulation protein YlmC with PRC-barrel domain
MVMLMVSFGYAAEEPAAVPVPQQAPSAVPATPVAEEPAATPAPQQALPAAPATPVAGSETLVIGVTVTELTNVVNGWSVKKKILGKHIYNDAKQKIGKVDDIIIGPDRAVTYAIIGAGGFLGIDKNDVAIPIKQFKIEDGKFILPGATKEALKKMPPFKYAK